MARVLSMTFLLPKLGVLYLFEIWLMAVSVGYVIKHARANAGLQANRLAAAHGALLLTSLALFIWSAFILAVAATRSGESYFYDFLLAAKFALYFVGCLIAGKTKISTYFFKHFDIVIYVFFTTCLGLYLLHDIQSASQRLWMANDFGARFVGFTGSSIGLSGISLLGSTANSVGMLFFLSFAFFWHQGKEIVPMAVTGLGCLLSFSQTAVLALLIFFAISVLQELKSKRVAFGGVSLVVCAFVFFFTQEFSVLTRLSGTATGLSNAQSFSTLGDRFLQLQTLGTRILECPSIINFGAAFADSSSCGETAIIESFFLNQLSLYGAIGLLLSLFHFMLFSMSIRKHLFGGSSVALGLWFGANLVAANTYQTDFLMMTFLLLLSGSYYRGHSKI